MTKAQAKAVFIWGTAFSTIILLALTYNSISQIPERTNQNKLDAQVAAGKWIWQKHNCNDCHTILGIGHWCPVKNITAEVPFCWSGIQYRWEPNNERRIQPCPIITQ
ncbi:MAG: hypothetical protein P8Z71_02195, partial [Candidatus Sulfobium sp.]